MGSSRLFSFMYEELIALVNAKKENALIREIYKRTGGNAGVETPSLWWNCYLYET